MSISWISFYISSLPDFQAVERTTAVAVRASVVGSDTPSEPQTLNRKRVMTSQRPRQACPSCESVNSEPQTRIRKPCLSHKPGEDRRGDASSQSSRGDTQGPYLEVPRWL